MRAFYYVSGVVVFALLAALVWVNNDADAPILVLVLTFGALGAIVREHAAIRANAIAEHAPQKINSVIICFSPLVGGLLALVLMALFLSGIISGDLFPKFLHADAQFVSGRDVLRGGITLESNSDFYKLIAWSIIAGYSKMFVSSKLEALTGGGKKKLKAD